MASGDRQIECLPIDRVIELERADAARKALETAIENVDGLRGGQTYQKAHKQVRAMLKALMNNLT